MSDYLFLTNVGDGIVNSINLTNLVPNRRSSSADKIDYKLGVFTQKLDSLEWIKIDETEFRGENNITLSSLEYDLDVGQLAVVIPVSVDEELLDSYSILPEPISRKVDKSPVNERATIHFSKDKAFSSYQGEFPYQMSRLKGTFLAFDPLVAKHSRDFGVKTKLVLINIHSTELNSKPDCFLKIADANTKELIKVQRYVQNSAVIMEIDEVNDIELCFYSKDTLGIPLFISYDDSGFLSIEHTHPPSEFFWKEKIKGQRLLKQSWLTKLP